MKKTIFILLPLLIAGCNGTIKNENGSENLIKLESEPVACEYLYKITAESTVYDQTDAVRHMENRIAAQSQPGNAYLVISEQTRPNAEAVFGPKNTYILSAKVYNCPSKK